MAALDPRHLALADAGPIRDIDLAPAAPDSEKSEHRPDPLISHRSILTSSAYRLVHPPLPAGSSAISRRRTDGAEIGSVPGVEDLAPCVRPHRLRPLAALRVPGRLLAQLPACAWALFGDQSPLD
jgi:hypothetical protein